MQFKGASEQDQFGRHIALVKHFRMRRSWGLWLKDHPPPNPHVPVKNLSRKELAKLNQAADERMEEYDNQKEKEIHRHWRLSAQDLTTAATDDATARIEDTISAGCSVRIRYAVYLDASDMESSDVKSLPSVQKVPIGLGPRIASAGVTKSGQFIKGEPVEFTIGDGTMIKGIEKGLIGMTRASRRFLCLPPHYVNSAGSAAVWGPHVPENASVLVELAVVSFSHSPHAKPQRQHSPRPRKPSVDISAGGGSDDEEVEEEEEETNSPAHKPSLKERMAALSGPAASLHAVGEQAHRRSSIEHTTQPTSPSARSTRSSSSRGAYPNPNPTSSTHEDMPVSASLQGSLDLLKELNLDQYTTVVIREHLSLDDMRALDASEWKELIPVLGHRKKLQKHFEAEAEEEKEKRRPTTPADSSSTPDRNPPPRSRHAVPHSSVSPSPKSSWEKNNGMSRNVYGGGSPSQGPYHHPSSGSNRSTPGGGGSGVTSSGIRDGSLSELLGKMDTVERIVRELNDGKIYIERQSPTQKEKDLERALREKDGDVVTLKAQVRRLQAELDEKDSMVEKIRSNQLSREGNAKERVRELERQLEEQSQLLERAGLAMQRASERNDETKAELVAEARERIRELREENRILRTNQEETVQKAKDYVRTLKSEYSQDKIDSVKSLMDVLYQQMSEGMQALLQSNEFHASSQTQNLKACDRLIAREIRDVTKEFIEEQTASMNNEPRSPSSGWADPVTVSSVHSSAHSSPRVSPRASSRHSPSRSRGRRSATSSPSASPRGRSAAPDTAAFSNLLRRFEQQ